MKNSDAGRENFSFTQDWTDMNCQIDEDEDDF